MAFHSYERMNKGIYFENAKIKFISLNNATGFRGQLH